jgi:hypothetical protein
MDFLLDPETHDLVLQDGELVMVEDVAGDPAEIGQRVKVTLLTQLDTWQFNTDFGVPWVGGILEKPADLDLAEAILTAILIQIDGVEAVEDMTLTFDPVSRDMTVAANLQTLYGPVGVEAQP